MYNFKKGMLVGVVFLVALMSLTSITTANDEAVNDKGCSHMDKIAYERKAIRPHFNFYYQLLAEKYAPEYVEAWNEIISDRDAIMKKYKELKKSGKNIEKPYNEVWLEKHRELQEEFLKAVKKRDDKILKEIVPKVIEHQKELNAMWKDSIKKVK